MKKIIVGLFVAIFLILGGGGINYHFSLPVKPFDVFLLVVGIVILLATIAAAIIIFLRRRSHRSWQDWMYLSLTIAIFGTADTTCAAGVHDVLIPPEATPMIQRSLVAGSETWIIIGTFVAIGFIWIAIFRFIRNRDDRTPAEL
jgi:hypothetical protein